MKVHYGLKDDFKAVMKRGAYGVPQIEKQNEAGLILSVCLILCFFIIIIVSF